jgi:hypothetical protein
MSKEKDKVVEAEVQRIHDAKVIRGIMYPVWLSNTVPMNKACKKDDYPLERVDKVVDDAANSEMLSLLDKIFGYHQVRERKEDEEKKSFITPFKTYSFSRLPEGAEECEVYILKNDGNCSPLSASEKYPSICRRHNCASEEVNTLEI